MSSAAPDYYYHLVKYSEKLVEDFPTKNVQQIKIDLPRTFADEVFFNQKSQIGKEV